MNLSELVLLKNQLDARSTSALRDEVSRELNEINFLVNSKTIDHTPIFEEHQQSIQQSFDTYEHELNLLKNEIKEKIAIAEKPYFQRSYDIYQNEMTEGLDVTFGVRQQPRLDREIFRSRLRKYTDWKYSAMCIRPAMEDFIDDMVACDPLYLVDLSHDHLLPALGRFNEKYQNRLRTYTVNEDLAYDNKILGRIPDNQFGLCFAFYYFNFRPIEYIKKWLTEIYQKLKPGGVLAMTFNDCERSSAVIMVEEMFCAYTPGYLVYELATSIGYEIEFVWHDERATTWVEFKKPGQLETLKGGQTLAKIVSKQL
jgi:SAM-dependent methyltransferase